MMPAKASGSALIVPASEPLSPDAGTRQSRLDAGSETTALGLPADIHRKIRQKTQPAEIPTSGSASQANGSAIILLPWFYDLCKELGVSGAQEQEIELQRLE
jgi:hypothetical protein